MTPEEEIVLIEELARFEKDPLGFALWAFPWGEPGSPLENEQLEEWQIDTLTLIGERLEEGAALSEALEGMIPPVRVSTATGHGVGKSALAAIITWWAMSTMPDTKGVVTANTETQLKTKTWPEIAKWHRMFIARELFEVTATALFPKDPEHQRTWRIDIVPWSEKNTEAFAGLHNKDRRVFILFDEASAIHETIWEVAEGALTDANTQIIWVAFGNPTKNTGRFRATAPDGRFGRRWNFRSLDSRTVRRTNKIQIEEWRQDYGEDSDFFRVRVLGAFPRTDNDSFISFAAAQEATLRPVPEVNEGALILGVDVARYGDDRSVLYWRRGTDARSMPPQWLAKASTVTLAREVRDQILTHHPDAVFIDETGVGAGVLDMLLDWNLPTMIVGVNFSSAPDGLAEEKCANKRAEIWQLMKDWLPRGCIPENLPGTETSFVEELCGVLYGFNGRDAIQLESKKDMKRRGVPSPDYADALALTFTLPVMPPGPVELRLKPHVEPDYDPMESI